MNNQFFGDERDFYKYGILRMLSNRGERPIGVCWLLTNDCKNGGGKLAYLKNPQNKECNKDPELFNFLRQHVCQENRRDVELLKEKNIIEGASYFDDLFPDSEVQRKEYFNKMQRQFSDRELVFFDPDTGIQYGIAKIDKKKHNEYIELEEIKNIFSTAHNSSFMFFQYFRLPLQTQTQIKKSHTIWEELSTITKEKASIHIIFREPVAYYFIVRKNHSPLIKNIKEAAEHFGFVYYDKAP